MPNQDSSGAHAPGVEGEPTVRDDGLLLDLECLYRQTGNPIYPWWALYAYCPPDKPLPAWVGDYLRGCATAVLRHDQPAWPSTPDDLTGPRPGYRGVTDLFDAVDRGELQPEEAVKALPLALGMVRTPNWNAFREHREIEQNAKIALAYEMRLRNNSGTSDSLLQKLSRLHRITPRALQRRISAARASWEGQKRFKAARRT